jgi:hypothetical protein
MFGIDFGQKVGDHWWANSITQHEEGVAVLPRQGVPSREAHGHLGLGNTQHPHACPAQRQATPCKAIDLPNQLQHHQK